MKGFLNKVKGSVATTKEDPKASQNVPATETTPRADVVLPKGHNKRRNSLAKGQKQQVILKELPLLVETPMQKREVIINIYLLFIIYIKFKII